jgi:beta-lactamase regulating signal transducer with metallopeptidase domain
MSFIIDIQSLNQFSQQLLQLLQIAFVQGLIVFILATFSVLGIRRLSSGFKHILWLSVVFSFLIIPLFSKFIPSHLFRTYLILGIQNEIYEVYGAMNDILLKSVGSIGSNIYPAQANSSIAGDTLDFTVLHSSWSFIIIALWIMGMLLSSLRVIIGKVNVSKITMQATVCRIRKYTLGVEELSKMLAIKKSVVLLTSSECKFPFTYRIFKPVIILPSGISNWPSEQLRAVLIHELAHVKRQDYITQLIARFICSVFWFIPVVWIAYHHLHIEQEKSCDTFAVESGIEADSYARHILNVIRIARGRALLTGMLISKGSKKILEKRILHIFKLKPMKFHTNVKHAGATIMVCFLFLLPVLVFNPLFAQDEEGSVLRAISGTWINEDYDTLTGWPSKWVVKSDGTYDWFCDSFDTDRSGYGEYKAIVETWTDPEGNNFYKATYKVHLTTSVLYEIGKINSSRTEWESVWSGVDFPNEIDPNHGLYRIHYRQ